MPDLYPNDAAGSGAPLPPETMIVEVRLRSPGMAATDSRPLRAIRFARTAGMLVLVLTTASIVYRLLGS